MKPEKLKDTIHLSIQQYEHMLEYMKRLDREVGTASSPALIKLNATLLELQKNTSETEQYLFSQLSKNPEKRDSIKSLIELREHLINDILYFNQRITTKAVGVKSFITHEMGKLHTGLSAMQGYRQQQYNHGRIVNSAR